MLLILFKYLFLHSCIRYFLLMGAGKHPVLRAAPTRLTLILLSSNLHQWKFHSNSEKNGAAAVSAGCGGCSRWGLLLMLFSSVHCGAVFSHEAEACKRPPLCFSPSYSLLWSNTGSSKMLLSGVFVLFVLVVMCCNCCIQKNNRSFTLWEPRAAHVSNNKPPFLFAAVIVSVCY